MCLNHNLVIRFNFNIKFWNTVVVINVIFQYLSNCLTWVSFGYMEERNEQYLKKCFEYKYTLGHYKKKTSTNDGYGLLIILKNNIKQNCQLQSVGPLHPIKVYGHSFLYLFG